MIRRQFVQVASWHGLAAHAMTAPVGSREFFYRPEGAFAADFIPFLANGKFYLYYPHDWREVNHHGEGTPWYLVSTEDFVPFADHGETLARGTAQEQDLDRPLRLAPGKPVALKIFVDGTVCVVCADGDVATST